MRIIKDIKATDEFILQVKFTDGEERHFDMRPYLKYSVFEALTNLDLFKQATNKKYFIEWSCIDADLSADTIWHEGRSVMNSDAMK